MDLFQPSGAGKKKKRRRRDTYGDEEEIRTIGSARPLVKRNNFFPVASTSNSGKQESTKFKDNVGVTVYLPGGTMMARHSPLTWFHVICRTVNLVIVVTFSADKTHIFMFCVMPESDMLRRGSLERLFTKDPIFFRGIFRGPASILPVSSPFLSVPPAALTSVSPSPHVPLLLSGGRVQDVPLGGRGPRGAADRGITHDVHPIDQALQAV